MAGDEASLLDRKPELAFQRAGDRQAHRHQRRLGVLRQRQRLDRPFAHQLRQLLAECVIDLLEYLARRSEGLGQVRAHADGLAALSGKDEGEAHAWVSRGLKRAWLGQDGPWLK